MTSDNEVEREQIEAALGLAVRGFERRMLEQTELAKTAEFLATRDGHTPDFAMEPTYFDNGDDTVSIGVRLSYLRPGDDAERSRHMSIAIVDSETLSVIHDEHKTRSYRDRLEESGQEPTDELVYSAVTKWREAWNHIQDDIGDSLAVDPFYDTLIPASDLDGRNEMFDETVVGVMRIFRDVLNEDDLHILEQEFLVNDQITDLDGVIDYIFGRLTEEVDDPIEVLAEYGLLLEE